ncbi:hypothetical protein [Streptomyces misionensis]|uniref:hypothetical protein n=1 Tax=Streptomyces misionensis TaxID=67331 RepID=UPI0036CA7501
MNILSTLGILAAVFLAMPWLAIAFSRYCDLVNRAASRWRTVPEGTVCRVYKPPATAEDSGLCASCGMHDYKH